MTAPISTVTTPIQEMSLFRPGERFNEALFRAACVANTVALFDDLAEHDDMERLDPEGYARAGRRYVAEALAATLHQLTARADRLPDSFTAGSEDSNG